MEQIRLELQGTGTVIVCPIAPWIFPPTKRSHSPLEIYSNAEGMLANLVVTLLVVNPGEIDWKLRRSCAVLYIHALTLSLLLTLMFFITNAMSKVELPQIITQAGELVSINRSLPCGIYKKIRQRSSSSSALYYVLEIVSPCGAYWATF